MDTTSVIEVLSKIPIGTIVAWAMVIFSIIGAIAGLAVKMYKVFSKYRDKQDENELLRSTVDQHTENITRIFEKINSMNDTLVQKLAAINGKLDSQEQTKIKELRHTLVSVCEEALEKKKISIRSWSSLQEMFAEYENKYRQNSYVKSLMARVERDVEIVGKLDEHGNDIEEGD